MAELPERQHSAWVTKLIHWTNDPVLARKVHGWATIFWLVMAVPSALTGLKTSISYLVFLSVYAIVTGHWSGYQATGAEIKVENSDVDVSTESGDINVDKGQRRLE